MEIEGPYSPLQRYSSPCPQNNPAERDHVAVDYEDSEINDTHMEKEV